MTQQYIRFFFLFLFGPLVALNYMKSCVWIMYMFGNVVFSIEDQRERKPDPFMKELSRSEPKLYVRLTISSYNIYITHLIVSSFSWYLKGCILSWSGMLFVGRPLSIVSHMIICLRKENTYLLHLQVATENNVPIALESNVRTTFTNILTQFWRFTDGQITEKVWFLHSPTRTRDYGIYQAMVNACSNTCCSAGGSQGGFSFLFQKTKTQTWQTTNRTKHRNFIYR